MRGWCCWGWPRTSPISHYSMLDCAEGKASRHTSTEREQGGSVDVTSHPIRLQSQRLSSCIQDLRSNLDCIALSKVSSTTAHFSWNTIWYKSTALDTRTLFLLIINRTKMSKFTIDTVLKINGNGNASVVTIILSITQQKTDLKCFFYCAISCKMCNQEQRWTAQPLWLHPKPHTCH